MKICILGQGNVGTHLAEALAAGAEVELINSRRPEERPDDADIYIIATTDSAIAGVSAAIEGVKGIVVHTSGSTPIDVLRAHPRRGVFYPLQTFSKNIPLDYSRIPVFIEAESETTALELKKAASIFTESLHEADSTRREKLHLAAVFGCNFTTRMLALADEMLEAEGLSFDVLRPLLAQTMKKALTLTHPSMGQTGPASRGDRGIIAKHIQALADRPELASIYSLISENILNAHERNKL